MELLLYGVLITAFMMVTAKRMNSLLGGFRAQSLFLFFVALAAAASGVGMELYVVAALLFIIKVVLIPHFLASIVKKIKADENVGLFVNPTMSVFIALGLTYLSYLFAGKLIPLEVKMHGEALTVSLAVTLIGMFLIISRMKALVQIVGLLVMENGLFLAATAVTGGMPFFVEIAIFFDVLVCVIILGVFVHRINKVFTHIDINKLQELKG